MKPILCVLTGLFVLLAAALAPANAQTAGADLYFSKCSSCHGALASTDISNKTAAGIQNAITRNTGGMGFLSTLTPADVQAISDALLAPVPDTALPTVTALTLPATASALTVGITTLTATDNVGVTGYFLSESSIKPAATATGWTATKPTSYTFPAAGARTLYAYAKDAAGNVSASRSASVTITLAPPTDTTLPVVTAFTLPATASALTVGITSLTATDNVAVTGYFVSETATKPAATAAGWTATAPTSFTFPAAGARTLYAFAKDAAGNVSNALSASVTITLPPPPDTALPVVTAFTLPATASALTVSITSLIATDNVGVTGYFVSETATKPAASAAGWTATAPASFTFPAAGARTLYAFAKDAAGNVSNALSASVTITLPPPPDTTLPVVTAFALPATSAKLLVLIQTLTATDDVGVTGYFVSESSVKPAATAAGWTATAPANFTFPAEGARTLYAFAKDAAGNVSNALSASVTITLPPPPDTTPPVVSAFTLPATSATLSVPILTLAATDDVGVTGYFVSENATKPAATAAGWTATAPASFTFPAAGARTLYAFAKDAAGNVSNALSALVTITLPPPADTTLPVVSGFTIPATAATLSVPIQALTATDNVGVTGYFVSESSVKPAATAAGWTATVPASFTFTTPGMHTLWAFAKDAAGNVSNGASAIVSITTPTADTTPPTVTAFTLPATATSLAVTIGSLAATDDVAVTGYFLSESSAKPAASTAGWTAAKPTSYTFTAAGPHTLYVFAKDGTGNVSDSLNASVTITLPPPPPQGDTVAPVVTSFRVTVRTGSLKVTITSLRATDNVSVTGYMVTESSTKPLATADGWTATAPQSYTFTSAGRHSLYAWAKDAAGNVSRANSTRVTVSRPSGHSDDHSDGNSSGSSDSHDD